MFPFERFMAVLKKYVRNHAHPKGSIAKRYGTEEVIEFCVDFVDDLQPIGVPILWYEGRLSEKGTLGRKARLDYDESTWHKAHFTVLQQSSLVAPYMEEHMTFVRSSNHGKSEAWITREHTETFASWLRRRLMGVDTIGAQVAWLARGPSISVTTFQGYEINGYTFYTSAQDQKSTNQNSGVRIDAIDNTGRKNSYYGVIEDIWELDYGPLKIPLFRCQWVKLTGGGVTKDKYGMTIVDLNKIGYNDEPFVLANDVTQIIYVKDMSSKTIVRKGDKVSDNQQKRHIVLPGKRKIVGVEDKTDISKNFVLFDDIPPFSVELDPSIQLDKEDAPYLRRNHNQGTFVKRKIINIPLDDDV